MKPTTVTSVEEVFENIGHYQEALRRHPEILARVAMVWSWYACKDDSGRWKFAPSKFIGYRNAGAERYLAEAGFGGDLDGRITERVLSEWFAAPAKDSKLDRELREALRAFLAGFAKAPGARARINVPKSNLAMATPPQRAVPDLLIRITFDPEICSGRPCIKGTRMRVADIVEALAHGATRKQLLADFDYLDDDDISAALLYAARATDHRVLRTA